MYKAKPWAKPNANVKDDWAPALEGYIDDEAMMALANLSQHSKLGWMAANDLIQKLITKDEWEYRTSPSAFVMVCCRNAKDKIKQQLAKQGCPLYSAADT